MEIQATGERRLLMNKLYHTYYKYIYKPVASVYLRTDSNITFDGFKLKVLKDVFHPKLFFSSQYFYSFLKDKDFEGKTFLEIGCGSGILSLLAFKKNALVTAGDIDPKAIENTSLNFRTNFKDTFQKAEIIESDVFSRLQKKRYDVIAINPPYYFKKVDVNKQLAWYCGENGEYFEKLFSGLHFYMLPASKVYMILADTAETERIRSIAGKYNITFSVADEKQIKFEKNYIFQLSLPDSQY